MPQQIAHFVQAAPTFDQRRSEGMAQLVWADLAHVQTRILGSGVEHLADGAGLHLLAVTLPTQR